MERYISVRSAASAHKFCADRIRQKLVYGTNTETLLAEAFEMVRHDIADCFPSEDPFPDEDDAAVERGLREMAANNLEALNETESYMWGLGIAGIFHLWERSTRKVVVALSKVPPNPTTLDSMDFEALCKEVTKTGFAIIQHHLFPRLRDASLIANTTKHGRGTSFAKLVAEKPELFKDGHAGVRMGTLPPQPEDLRVSEKHFTEITTALHGLWSAYEHAALRNA